MCEKGGCPECYFNKPVQHLRTGEWSTACGDVAETTPQAGEVTCQDCRRATADYDLEEHLQVVLGEIRTLLVDRFRKYGPGNIAKHGELGLLVRLGDKFARLEHGLQDHADEALDDTINDVIGYGLIWKLWRKGVWPGSGQ